MGKYSHIQGSTNTSHTKASHVVLVNKSAQPLTFNWLDFSHQPQALRHRSARCQLSQQHLHHAHMGGRGRPGPYLALVSRCRSVRQQSRCVCCASPLRPRRCGAFIESLPLARLPRACAAVGSLCIRQQLRARHHAACLQASLRFSLYAHHETSTWSSIPDEKSACSDPKWGEYCAQGQCERVCNQLLHLREPRRSASGGGTRSGA